MPDRLATVAELRSLVRWLESGCAYLEHPDGQEGTDRAAQAARDAIRLLTSNPGKER